MFFFIYNIFAHFFKISKYYQTLTMGKGFDRVYKHIQIKRPYPYPKSTFIVPSRSVFTSQHDSTNGCGVTLIFHKKTFLVSHLTTTTQVDTGSNNDDDTQSFSTPRKHNNKNPEIPETTTTTTTV